MKEEEFLKNVLAIIDMMMKNAAHSFGVDFMILNNTAVEADKRLKKIEGEK